LAHFKYRPPWGHFTTGGARCSPRQCRGIRAFGNGAVPVVDVAAVAAAAAATTIPTGSRCQGGGGGIAAPMGRSCLYFAWAVGQRRARGGGEVEQPTLLPLFLIAAIAVVHDALRTYAPRPRPSALPMPIPNPRTTPRPFPLHGPTLSPSSVMSLGGPAACPPSCYLQPLAFSLPLLVLQVAWGA